MIRGRSTETGARRQLAPLHSTSIVQRREVFGPARRHQAIAVQGANG